MVLKQTDSKVTPYQAFLTEVYEKLPAFSTNSRDGSSQPQFVNEKGKIIKYSELSSSQKNIWKEYKLVQYDMTTGKQYCILQNRSTQLCNIIIHSCVMKKAIV